MLLLAEVSPSQLLLPLWFDKLINVSELICFLSLHSAVASGHPLTLLAAK